MAEVLKPTVGAGHSYGMSRWLALAGVVGPIMFVLAFS